MHYLKEMMERDRYFEVRKLLRDRAMGYPLRLQSKILTIVAKIATVYNLDIA